MPQTGSTDEERSERARRAVSRARPLAPIGGLVCVLVLAGSLAQPVLAQPLPSLRALDAGELAELSLSAGQHLALDLPARIHAPLELSVPLGNEMHTIVVEPHSLRGPGFRVLVPGHDAQLIAIAPPPPQTVLGRVVGDRGSVVAGSISNGRLELLVRRDDDERLWAIEPLHDGGHALYEHSDALDAGTGAEAECGMVARASSMQAMQAMAAMAALEPSPSRDVVEIALDADYELYLAQSESVDDVVAELETLIAGVRTIYEDQLDISYEITSITVRTEPDDPYFATDATVLLDELRSEWSSSSMLGVQRDVAYLFTHRDLDGSTVGIAYLDEMCVRPRAYGLTQTRSGFGLSRSVSITAHELAHVWSAPHCDGDPDCGVMCSTLFTCPGGIETFGSLARTSILEKQLEVSCLESVPLPGFPALNSVFPDFGRARGGGVIELHGTDLPFDESLRVTLGGAEADVLAASETLVTATVPSGEGGQWVDARIEGETYYTELDAAFRYELDMDLGDRVTSSLSSFETERFYFDGLSGAEVSVDVGPKSKGMTLGLRLVGPAEDVLVDVQGKAGRPASLEKYALDETGEYRLEAYTVGATGGDYQLKTKRKLIKSISTTLPVSRAQPVPTIAFSAEAGTMAQVRFQALKPKGELALVDGEPADLAPTLVALIGPAGPVSLDTLLEYSRNGGQVRVKNLLLPDRGDYTLQLGGLDESIGHGKAIVKLKAPRSSKERYELD